MILLVTNERDITTDYIVAELKRRHVEYYRLNTERISDARVWYRPEANNANWAFVFGTRTFSTNEIASAYFRRPGAPIVPETIADVKEREYCEREWASLLHSLYSALGDKWFNSPTNIALAEDKPHQLALAASIGFRIPKTLITNDCEAAGLFISSDQTIAKPLRTALIDADGVRERVVFTTRLGSETEIEQRAMAVAPVIFQEEIPKRFDVRVTVVGKRVFATTINSQENAETSVDWRRSSHIELTHAKYELPSDIRDLCVQLVVELGLRFAAIDLIQDRHGNFWFLEANPNGQWAWIENRTGYPISSAIVDELTEIGCRS